MNGVGEMYMHVAEDLTVYPIIVPTKSSLRSYNFFLVEVLNTYILVDAGENSPDCWEALCDVLAENGVELSQIEAIFLTHSHADHIGLVNRIVARHPIPIYAHPNAIKSLRRDEMFLKDRITNLQKTYEEMGAGEEVDKEVSRLYKALEKNRDEAVLERIHFLREGDSFFGFRVLELFGHTQDHIALYDETSGTLLSGDHLLKRMTTNALLDFDKEGERVDALSMYENSLQRIKRIPLRIVYPGHGACITDPYAEINSHLRKINKQAKRMLEYVRTETTAAHVAKEMYSTRYEQLFPLVMSLVIGHFDRLERLGRVKKRLVDRIYYYRRM